jgi:Class III cytochrome C family
MKKFSQYSVRMILVGMILGLLILVGCSKKETEPAPALQGSQATDQKAQSAPTSAELAPPQEAPTSSSPAGQPAPKTAPAQLPKTSSPQATKPQSTPGEKPVPAGQTTKAAPKDMVLLKASLGTVHFQHKIHSESRKIACETCHHANRPEKPGTAPQEACSTCHALTAKPPMKTKLQAAFHNPTATAGTCIDCHKAQNAKGEAAPVKCLECHKKEPA